MRTDKGLGRLKGAVTLDFMLQSCYQQPVSGESGTTCRTFIFFIKCCISSAWLVAVVYFQETFSLGSGGICWTGVPLISFVSSAASLTIRLKRSRISGV